MLKCFLKYNQGDFLNLWHGFWSVEQCSAVQGGWGVLFINLAIRVFTVEFQGFKVYEDLYEELVIRLKENPCVPKKPDLPNPCQVNYLLISLSYHHLVFFFPVIIFLCPWTYPFSYFHPYSQPYIYSYPRCFVQTFTFLFSYRSIFHSIFNLNAANSQVSMPEWREFEVSLF